MDSRTLTILLLTVQKHFAYNPIFHFLTQIVPCLPLRGLSLSVAHPKPLFVPLTSMAVFVCFVQTLISWHSEMFSAHRAHFPLRHGARHFFKELCFYLLRDSSDISFWERSVRAVTFPFCSLPTKLHPAHLSGSRWRKYRLFSDFYLKDLNLLFFFSCVWNFPLSEPAFFACYTCFMFYTILSNFLQDTYFTHVWGKVLIILNDYISNAIFIVIRYKFKFKKFPSIILYSKYKLSLCFILSPTYTSKIGIIIVWTQYDHCLLAFLRCCMKREVIHRTEWNTLK